MGVQMRALSVQTRLSAYIHVEKLSFWTDLGSVRSAIGLVQMVAMGTMNVSNAIQPAVLARGIELISVRLAGAMLQFLLDRLQASVPATPATVGKTGFVLLTLVLRVVRLVSQRLCVGVEALGICGMMVDVRNEMRSAALTGMTSCLNVGIGTHVVIADSATVPLGKSSMATTARAAATTALSAPETV
jgi:hypothetical protein